MARRPDNHFALEAVRTAIGAELKKIHSGVLREPIPVEIAELLRQLDEPRKSQSIDDS
jgi:Anti-sigma factor NepR